MPDARAIDQFLKRVALRLAERLGASRCNLRLVVPLDGAMSIVRVVEAGGVARAAVRVYESGWRRGRELEQRLHADVAVWRHGLDAPRILDVVEARRLGIVAVAEEFVSGEHPFPEKMTPDKTRALARTLARLHRVRRQGFGRLGAERTGDFSSAALGQVANRFRSVARWAPPAVRPEAQRRVRGWFERQAPRTAQPDGYSLIHDKPNRGNLLYDAAADRFRFIDLATLRYGASAKDLVQAIHEVIGFEQPLTDAFLEAYYGELAVPGARERDDARRPFWHAYYHLSQCAINCRRLRKSGRGDGENQALKAVNHWNRLLRVLDES